VVVVAESKHRPKSLTKRFSHWLLKTRAAEPKDQVAKEGQPEQHSRCPVMCLAGVDCFSTLGYMPAIAGLAAGPSLPLPPCS
jgi:hypothetical protein